ncbi:MAG: hypothetical protein D8B50_05460 [Prevotella sp.]|nr:MAG: hypothetical protein D8B50_05460 [Prevotella sp.]
MFIAIVLGFDMLVVCCWQSATKIPIYFSTSKKTCTLFIHPTFIFCHTVVATDGLHGRFCLFISCFDAAKKHVAKARSELLAKINTK